MHARERRAGARVAAIALVPLAGLLGTVDAARGARTPASQDDDGPKAEETERLEARVRLTDADGEPLADGWVTVWVAPQADAPAFPDAEPVRVSSGLLTLVRGPGQELPDPGWWVLGRWGKGDCVATAAIPLPPAGTSGRVDLGEVALVAPPLVAAGRVVDVDEAPVEGVRVFMRPSGEGASATVVTGAEGTFEFRGWMDGSVELRLGDYGYLTDAQRVEAESDDVVLHVPEPDVRGRLLLPAGWEERDVRISVSRAGDGWSRGATARLSDGSFQAWLGYGRVGEQRPSSPDASTSVQASYRDVSGLWEQTFEAGEPVPDEVVVDLRHLGALDVQLVGPDGRGVGAAGVTLLEAAGGLALAPGAPAGARAMARGGLLGSVDGAGHVALVAAGPGPVRLRVWARGFRTREVELDGPEAGGGPRVVLLEPALDVRITALDAPRLDPARWSLSVYAVSQGSDQGGFCSAKGLCHPGSGDLQLDLQLPAEGSWSLRWWLHHRERPGAAWRDHLVQTPEVPFEVTGAGQRFEVPAPSAEIEAAVARLGG